MTLLNNKQMFDAKIDEWRFRNEVPDEPLFMTALAKYKHFDPVRISLSSGDPLVLVRRPENKSDRNAIEVFTDISPRKSIGFLPREVSKIVSPSIDSGEEISARFHAESDVASGMIVIHGDVISELIPDLRAVSDADGSDTPIYVKDLTQDINIRWYDENANVYSVGADRCNPQSDMSAFLSTLPPGAKILDAGCGNGRDMAEMMRKGYQVSGFDASGEMVRMAKERTDGNANLRQMRFSEFEDAPDTWDGIWAMASLVHVEMDELPDVVNRMMRSLKPGGTLFAALKAGDMSNVAPDGRRMMRVNEETVRAAFVSGGDLRISKREIMTSSGAPDNWINVIYSKSPEPEPRMEDDAWVAEQI